MIKRRPGRGARGSANDWNNMETAQLLDAHCCPLALPSLKSGPSGSSVACCKEGWLGSGAGRMANPAPVPPRFLGQPKKLTRSTGVECTDERRNPRFDLLHRSLLPR